MLNAKNQVLELLDARGLPRSRALFTSHQIGVGPWMSTLVLDLPDRAPVTGTGTGQRKSSAEIAAAEDLLVKLEAQQHVDVLDGVQADAQSGDALVKLVAYLATGLDGPEARSFWLQQHESDGWLAGVFDRWYADGDPDLATYGEGLGEKNKATIVEALIWRRFGARVLAPGAIEALDELRQLLARR